MAENSGDQTIITPAGGRKEAKNLVDVISEIQVMNVAEASGASEINKNYFTWQMNIEFFAVGFKAFLAGFILCLPLVPLAVAVSYNLVPVYGGAASLYDKIFMFILAFSMSFGSLIILFTAAKYVHGILTYQMTKALYIGAIVSSLIKGFVLFFIFQVLAVLINPEFITKHLLDILKIFSLKPRGLDQNIANIISEWVHPIFRISSVLMLVFAFIASFSLTIALLRCRHSYKQFKAVRDYTERGDA